MSWVSNKQEEHEVTLAMSPNGSMLVFSAVNGFLYLLDLKSRRVTKLSLAGHAASPAFSPDSSRIAYCASAPGENGASLYELSLPTKIVRRLTHEANASDSQPSYSADGTQIAFVRAYRYRTYSMGGMVWSDHDICVMQAADSKVTRLTNYRLYSAGSPRFSKDGKTILFSANLPLTQSGSLTTLVEISALAPGRIKPVPPLPRSGKQRSSNGSEPIYSPATGRVAFLSDRAQPYHYDLYTMRPDGSDLRRLHITKISAYNQQPVFAPDGKSLLFLAGTESDAQGRPLFSLWQVNADGTGAHRIADESLFTHPDTWQPRAPLPATAAALKAFLARGGSPGARDSNGRTLLSNAASQGDAARVRLLLQKGAKPNAPDTDGSLPLARALERDQLEVVKLLLANGADANAAPRNGPVRGTPPLCIAALSGSIGTVQALLRAGARVNVTGATLSDTPLHLACSQGDLAMARLFLAKGSVVDARNAMGITPLMNAASAGNPALVKLLLARGAKVNARDDRTRQLYGMAQFTGDEKTAEEIRKSGRLNTLHEDGRSVLDWAHIGNTGEVEKNAEVIALLKKAGAKE